MLYQAHKGVSTENPENTMPAMIAAVEMGCDAIETDVRRTADGHLVLIHDRDVARTTNGQGNVDEMTLARLRALDAGAWKDPAFAGTRIPTVEEFLEYVHDKNVIINWELKEYPKELGEEWAYGTIDALVELIDRFGDPPKSLLNLIGASLLRNTAGRLGITEISQKRGALFFFVTQPNAKQLQALMVQYYDRIAFNDKTAPYYVAIRVKKNELSVDLMRDVIAIFEKNAITTT